MSKSGVAQIAEQIHNAHEVVIALKQEIEAGNLNPAEIERARNAALRLRDEAFRLDRQLEDLEAIAEAKRDA